MEVLEHRQIMVETADLEVVEMLTEQAVWAVQEILRLQVHHRVVMVVTQRLEQISSVKVVAEVVHPHLGLTQQYRH
jgi:hypothetical protein